MNQCPFLNQFKRESCDKCSKVCKIRNIIDWLIKNQDLIDRSDFVRIVLDMKKMNIKGSIQNFPDNKL
ncbi:MAG: hypothetical protein UT24_C0029G0018 [Candidatus Woesebacteria bacterium GW2011_GWB1_39_12]|uniref:Uncharacterized protein n=1 Tax=Candidatus Woesebacteria bacterium GW2011_GWB1_39_12 TaxID=1618574 RepID=A0A0G0QBB7_9BACT|nr:MAG: hypothetical protein UT24_C0029G0018 [Candidatus Woesebacteria bacterium GW2011_GWB1_39_12]